MKIVTNDFKIKCAAATMLMITSLPAFADITHSGTVAMLRNYAATANVSYVESWTWFQIAGLVNVDGCPNSDDGVGSLTGIAIAGEDELSETLLLTAFLSGEPVKVIIDETQLYEGQCVLKKLLMASNEAQ